MELEKMLSFVTLLLAFFIVHSEAFLVDTRPRAVYPLSWQKNAVWQSDPLIPLGVRVPDGNVIRSNSVDDEEKPAGTSRFAILRRIGVRSRLKRLWCRIGGPKTVASLVLALLCGFGNVSAATAVTGGRMGGGSFNSRSSTAPSRSRPQSYSYSTPRPYTPRYSNPRPMVLAPSFSGLSEWYAPSRSTLIVNTRVSAKDIAILTGAGVLLSYGYRNNLQRRRTGEDGGPLGPGYTVGSVTVALQLPDRSADNNNILRQLSQWSLSADTVTRKGLQDLLSSVALELLRNEPFIQSAVAQSQQYAIAGQAEREFQVLSVGSQSKVDRLTVNKFGAQNHFKNPSDQASVEASSSPTTAIVTLNFCMEGDSTALPVIRSREDLRTALSLIASDALVGGCLVTAEILWSPEDPSEVLTNEEVIANYPDLVPI